MGNRTWNDKGVPFYLSQQDVGVGKTARRPLPKYSYPRYPLSKCLRWFAGFSPVEWQIIPLPPGLSKLL